VVSGDFTAADSLAERSVTVAETGRLETSPWAWLARAAVAGALLTVGGGPDGLGPAELALAAAEARQDQAAASFASSFRMIFLWAAHSDQAAAAMLDALDRAQRTGSPGLIAFAVALAASCHESFLAEPDFAASLGVLTRYDDGIRTGQPNEMWLELGWGIALLGLGQPGAIEHLTNAARLADRISFPHAVEMALRPLAIAYAEAGHTQQAAILTGYTDANLAQYRLDLPGRRWINPTLDAALAGPADRPLHETEGSTWHRRQIMALINNPPTQPD
jgi:hypothetical protein